MNLIRFAWLSVVFIAMTLPAGADWSQVESEQLVEAVDRSIIRHEWTTATDSTPYDISQCGGAVEVRFDPSTGDASTDATVDFMLCRNSTDTWQRCRSQGFAGPSDGTTWVPINAVTEGEHYILANALTSTSGGDTARAEVRCTEERGLAEGASGGGGTGLAGWPSFVGIGGTGRPTQAIVIDSLAYSTKLTGSGRDDNGSTWGGSCTGDATTDQPCTQSVDSIAGLSIAIDGNTSAFGTSIDWDIDGDAQASLFCRDSSTFAHQIGTANDTSIAADGDYIATVLRDDSSDTYRLVSTYLPSVDCVNRTGNITMGGSVSYATATDDDLMVFIMDAIHLSPYGSRWTIQEVLTAAWEDQFPEMLGLTNLITNGYMETNCSDGSPLTASGGGGWVVRAGSDVTALNRPIVGQGCEWDVAADTDARTAATAVIDAEPGSYYVGSVNLGSGGATTDRSLIVRIRDDGGANIENSRFWVGGQPTGIAAERASVVDATGAGTPGEYQMQSLNCYGGCIIKFAFQVPAGATGFDIQFAQTDVATQFDVYIDELWVREKIHQDLERHPIIADGRAKIQLFTDSRGLATRYENLQDSFDYFLGETTKSGEVRAEGSLRPDLHLTEKVSLNTFSVSGQRLGNYVGENDGYLNYSGASAGVPTLDSLIEDDTHYCIEYFGINDLTAGARPTSATLASDSAANRYRYWADQLRGFEIAAEKAGCIPIAVMEPVVRGDSTTTTCSNAAGSAVNCAAWHREAWKNILHNGLP